MQNPTRGEIELQLGEQTLKGKVTLDTIMRIESGLGIGIVKVAQRLQEGDLKAADILSILTPVIRAGGNNIDQKAVGEIVWQAGLADGMREVGRILAMVLTTGGDEGNVAGSA